MVYDKTRNCVAMKAIGVHHEKARKISLVFYQNLYPVMRIINVVQVYYIAEFGMLEHQCSTVFYLEFSNSSLRGFFKSFIIQEHS
jgi:hypothetical protein